ncbi:hypothetical protein PIB30_089522 [Stylosanthes scabra]|uniref:Transposase (Putative), gypsy type n=1 Tax=Stylosanthes scabra TaxID=79078 RepID=A0ABU6WVB8_9FABA|nr:hypothetical protein [Stylosanthes scabra]
MGKKKACQNVKVPRPLAVVEQGLYGWVEESIFTQPSVIEESLPELRRHMALTEDAAAEGDFVLDAAGPSDRLPFQANEGDPHFLWVYQELFTRLGVRLPFTDFQKEVMTQPTGRLFLYIYDILIPPSGYGFISFRARQGCKLFGNFEESIQEFKCHYFKVLPAPGRRAFWLDDRGNPFPWVYWNRGVKDFVIHSLDPLETAAFDFLVSLPAGLPKKNDLTCRWILDNPDAVVGKFPDDLFLVGMKKTKLDRMMADPSRKAPRAILPTGAPSATVVAVAAASSAAVVEPSANPATLAVQVPPPPPTSSRAKKSSSKRERSEVVNVDGEEDAKEDPEADFMQKRRRREKGKEKGKEEDVIDLELGEDVAWEHAVNPLDLAFPKEYNYQKALDGGLTSCFVRKHLQGMLPDQFLGESWRLQCQALACQQVYSRLGGYSEGKNQELLFVKDRLSVLKVERDSALEYLPLKEKADSLAQQLSQKEVEHQSALERVAQLDNDLKVLKAQLESAQLSVSKDQRRAESAESNAKTLAASLETVQTELVKARDEADYWCVEWKSLSTEAQEMCRRIHVREEFLGDGDEVAETLPEQEQQQQENTLSGECPT